MQRIERIDETRAAPKTAELLAAVKAKMGGVPNILATMAQSPAALTGYLGFAGALAGGTLTARLREQIALAVAGANACDYCASVHTALGRQSGLSAEEMRKNLEGRSADPQVEAALRFATRVVTTRGPLADADVAALRHAGYGDEAIVEIVANTALNIFTNSFNHVAATDIDFPLVETTPVIAA